MEWKEIGQGCKTLTSNGMAWFRSFYESKQEEAKEVYEEFVGGPVVRMMPAKLLQEASKALELAERARVKQAAQLKYNGLGYSDVPMDPVLDNLTCIKALAADADSATPVVLPEEDYNLIIAVNTLIGKGYV